MIKTLLLCFIHGFKGDEETFFQFPEHLRALVSEKEPELDIVAAVYPKYETKGDLAACVVTFREWLQEQVATLERNAGTPSAIINPSVGVIIIAHSMGGFVAADTLFSVLDNRPISSDRDKKLMFPLIHGLLTFDTPYAGLSRSMFAYGAFNQYQNISSLFNVYSTIKSLGTGASTAQIASNESHGGGNAGWRRWQALAARTGTYRAIVAGGAAAYANRAEIEAYLSKINTQNISESWPKVNRETVCEGVSQGLTYVSRDSVGQGFAWLSGHLKFAGALMKQAQLQTRLQRLMEMRGIGVVNLYTSLGENGYWSGGYFVPKRTFCAVPLEKEGEGKRMWREEVNTKAADEIEAHCSMFQPLRNPRYDSMSDSARGLILSWIQNDPCKVVNEYKPDFEQRSRSNSEAQLFDDDGKVLRKDIGGEERQGEGLMEDELQLQAILKSDGMPQPEDGGISEEELRRACEVPLPPGGYLASVGEWGNMVTKPLGYLKVPGFGKKEAGVSGAGKGESEDQGGEVQMIVNEVPVESQAGSENKQGE